MLRDFWEDEYGGVAVGRFEPIADGKAVITVRDDVTLYDLEHELAHGDEWIELPLSGRKSAWEAIPTHTHELKVLERLRTGSVWQKLSSREQAHALQYVKDNFDWANKPLPNTVSQWIQEWEYQNPTLVLLEEHNKYLGIVDE